LCIIQCIQDVVLTHEITMIPPSKATIIILSIIFIIWQLWCIFKKELFQVQGGYMKQHFM
jgi:hypothetical protein